jgi:hypothetical protein
MTIVKRFLIRFTVFLTVWKKYFDPETGRDLVITINRNAQSKACVVTIVPLDSDVLSTGIKLNGLQILEHGEMFMLLKATTTYY